MKKIIRNVVLFLVVLVGIGAIWGISGNVEANTAGWSVYYASGGGSRYTHYVTIYTSGGGYEAKCTGTSGTCTSRTATVTCPSYGINKTVQFTATTAYWTSFNTNSVPTTNSVEFAVKLSCLGGNSASLTGSIRGK